VLDIRLNELDSVVDRFVLVEATKTYSGHDKPFFFYENRDRYARFTDRIIHVVVDDMPPVPSNGNRWPLEKHQRKCIVRGLEGCAPDDLIMISNADEIPSAGVVRQVKQQFAQCSARATLCELACNCLIRVEKRLPLPFAKRICRKAVSLLTPTNRIVKCLQKLYQYSLNGHVIDDWGGTTFIRFSTLQRVMQNDADAVRLLCNVPHGVVHGGWHFSYLGGADKIAQKIHAFAHGEFDKEKYTDVTHISEKMERGENLFDKGSETNKIKYVEIDRIWPAYVLQNRDRLAELIRPAKSDPRPAC
jgi:beta-1,4-mannosyl-glycoprotein beta-1,4-N-acetylglucosaminyltransferase